MVYMENSIEVAQSKSAATRVVEPDRTCHKAAPKVQIDPPLRDFARSHSINWRPPVSPIPEDEALESLKVSAIRPQRRSRAKDTQTVWRKKSRAVRQYDGYNPKRLLLYVDLVEFEIYRSPDFGHGTRKSELISLHQLEIPIPKRLCFDGYLRIGSVRHYVQGINIYDCSIEGYGDYDDPGVVTYLQSELSSKDAVYEVWYKLVRPTADYERFHKPFLWVAQLGKHVIDYLESQPARSVALGSFCQDFIRWLLLRYADNKSFKRWHLEFKDHLDFRVAVHAYLDYIYHQAFNLSNSTHLFSHPIWSECMIKGMTSIRPHPQVVQHALATPDVCDAFRSMYFGKNIQGMKPAEDVAQKQERRKRKLGFPRALKKASSEAPKPKLRLYGDSPVEVGDVVAVRPDETDRKTWRNSTGEWLAYVHGSEVQRNGVQKLSVLWLYRPCDTNIFRANYSFKNELFFSDNCNCGEGKLLSTDLAGRYDVQWSPKTIPLTQFFVRQTYVTRDSAFVTWKEEHKMCMCRRPKFTLSRRYHRGDTVYITRTLEGQKILDPTIIWAIDDSSNTVTIRKLLRLSRDCAGLAIEAGRVNTASNELVLTDEYAAIGASRIQRECFICFIPQQRLGSVPSPYDRGGAGDRWFVSMSMATNQNARLRFLSKSPSCFRQTFERTQSRRLKGLSIFSGGGSLDRGIEEGGAVEFHTAVDFSPHAAHTQKANAQNPDIRVYCGSVDDFFKSALIGKDPDSIATIGKVEFIAAGSPCPGFSALQQNFLSEASLRNASHISTFCSFVDLYRPLYGVLENVVNMASTRTGFEDQNVLSNVVASLVSMGYQVNQYIMDAWNYGSGQQRSRILLSIAAPGLTPIAQPWHTHSIKCEQPASKSLGKLPNGERFGEREHYPTPFLTPSAGQVTTDLPDIGNGNVQTCVPFPDHRVAPHPTILDRSLLKHIPKSPPGCGYTVALKLGIIPKMLQRKKNETGRAYSRIKEVGLIPCITTKLRIADACNGATVHWAQDRPITIMEARRAQNYPDHEPIIGTPVQQFEIVGNGVDRMVSLAFGLSLRQALQQSSIDLMLLTTSPTIEGSPQEASVFDELGDDGYLTDATRSIVHTDRRSHDTSQPETTYIEQTMIQTVTTHVNDLSMSTTTSFSRSTSILLHDKRQREITLSHDDIETITVGIAQENSRKRMKTIVTPRSSSVLTDRSTTSQSGVDTRTTSLSTTNSRRTRHSRLGIEFVPVNWNKKPETNQ